MLALRRILLAIVVLAACGGGGGGTLQAAIDTQLATNAKRHGIAGQAVLILHDDAVIYRGTHGLADREANRPVRPTDIFPVFSVSKLLCSILIMQLVERGEVDLKRPASRYVELPARWRDITVDEMLNHASGLPDYFDPDHLGVYPPTVKDVLASLADKPLVFAPSTEVRYTQTNYVVLGALLEAHYKMPYRQIVTERIVKPLALGNTYLGKGHVPAGTLVASYRGTNDVLGPNPLIDWQEYAIAHAELFTTIDDLATFMSAVRTGRLVKTETLLRLWKPYRLRDDRAGFWASGWDYEERGRYKQVGHDGGAVLRATLVFEDSLATNTYTYIYLTNGSAANVWSRTLIESVMPIVARSQ
jgi:CubicO group peptidase (beta-lactamase class C family)